MDMNALRTLQKARSIVVLGHPFFASLLLRQELVETTEHATLATNGKTLLYNAEWVVAQRPEHLQAAVAHEAMHVGLGHHVRRGNREPGRWNEACDYVTNPILVSDGFHLFDGALLRDDLKGLTAEQAFKVLQDEQQPEQDQDSDDQDDSQGSGDQGVDSQDADDSDDDAQNGDDGNQGSTDDQDGDSDDQGEASGDQGDDQDGGDGEPQPGTGGFGTVLDAPGDAIEHAQEANDSQIALTQAQSFAASSIPGGGLPEQIVAIQQPQVDWKEQLRRYLNQFDQADYSWSKGNRRFMSKGLYLPSLHSEAIPKILLVIDHSGSMPRVALEQFMSEMESIVESMRPERLDVISHTAYVTGEWSFEPGEEINISIPGSGGTAFAPVCEWIDQADEEYAVVIWFTDLMTWDWDQCVEPQAPVLWIDWTNHNKDRAAFGDDVIGLPPEDFYTVEAA